MNRHVEKEWLDELPANDRGAIGSRRDLRRLNWWMGNVRTMSQTLRNLPLQAGPIRLTELGAGDGDFLLRVARRLGGAWRGTRATLLDMQNLTNPETTRGFSEVGWNIRVVNCNVLDWCNGPDTEVFDLVVANLFLHHFSSVQLQGLLQTIRKRSSCFVAIEPQRSKLPLACSRLVGWIGCNAVTRHDAPASVRAGFSGRELSELWRGNGEWRTCEQPRGLFSHLFVAHKNSRAG